MHFSDKGFFFLFLIFSFVCLEIPIGFRNNLSKKGDEQTNLSIPNTARKLRFISKKEIRK